MVTSFWDGTGRTHGRTDGIGTDRLFSENIILDSYLANLRGGITTILFNIGTEESA